MVAMAQHLLSVGRLTGRCVDARAFRCSSVSNSSAPIFASVSTKCRPFFGARVASVSVPKRSKRIQGSAGLVRVQLNDGGFDVYCKVYEPCSEFYKVEAILRPWRVSPVSSALLKLGIRGVTVTEVRGFGAQGGSRERQAGTEFAEDSFLQKVKLEIVVSKEQVEVVIDSIIDQARTGEIGDGKIFVSPISDVIRVRTGERGLKAERMAGGRAAMQVSFEGSDED